MRSKWPYSVGIIVGLGCVFTLLGVFLREPEPKALQSCPANLMAIRYALHEYCQRGPSNYPSDLSLLRERSGFSGPWKHLPATTFVCPHSGSATGEISDVMKWTDYIYIQGLNPSSPTNIPILICPPVNHGGRGGYVLWQGNVQWKPAEEIEKLLASVSSYAESNSLRIAISPSVSVYPN